MSSGSDLRSGIFLYEDDADLAREVVLAFAAEGLTVEQVSTEVELRAHVGAGRSRVLILDRLIHGKDSLAIVESLRTAGERVPVAVISSLVSVDDRILGLKAGGDDYLIKPFAMSELIARVQALCRRAEGSRETRLTVGPLVLDLLDRTLTRGNRDIALLPREFSLLEYLMRHAGQVVTRTMLLENVWNYSASSQTNVVDVHVGNLRRKIDGEGESSLITSVRGLGFRLTADTV